MSSQTIYFDNPASITTLQGQVGGVANQVNTSVVNSAIANHTIINTTGTINNLGLNRFVDKYTINNGMGPYMVDAVPITFRDTFAMPKFSNNLSITTGGAYASTGIGGLHYTTQTFDTETGWDMVVYLPSNRTTMQTTPVFQETGAGEPMNLGSWGISLADFNGPLSTPYSSSIQWQASLGSTGLASAFNTFYNSVKDITSTTGTRNGYLNSIYSHPDYTTIKNQFKYPFKTYNQIKLTSDFQFEQLYSLSGAALSNTGADGITGYPTQITSTTYSATGNLLPLASNANSVNGKMGLFIFHMGDGNNMMIDAFAHQVASWGYAVAYVPGTPISNRINKYGSTRSLAKLIADGDIPLYTATGSLAGYCATGVATNVWSKYDTTNDNTTFPSSASTTVSAAGFWRLAFRQMLGTAPAQEIMERFYYQIKCVINQIGVGKYIDYTNVVVGGISGGGYACVSSNKFISNGLSTQYKLGGGSVPLFTAKAFIQLQPVLADYSLKVDAGATSNNNIYNNRYAVGINVLQCPLIALTTDGDSGNTAGAAAPLNDNRFNHQLQTIFQCTKQNAMSSSGLASIQNLNKSAVFYKSGSCHTDNTQISNYRPGAGQFSAAIYNETYYTEWLNGWYLSLNPQWPAIDDVYESGLQNELAYTTMNDIKASSIIELMAHRFLGNNYPVAQSMIQSVGLRCDIEPTHCEVIPEMEYLRVGPLAQVSYDDNYNIVFKNNPNIATSTQTFNVVATGAVGIFKGLAASTGAFTTSLTVPTIQSTTLNTTTVNATTGAFTTAFSLPVYTVSSKPVSGIVGQVIAISDSPTVAGKLAFWDTTNSRWSYVFDNSAV